MFEDASGPWRASPKSPLTSSSAVVEQHLHRDGRVAPLGRVDPSKRARSDDLAQVEVPGREPERVLLALAAGQHARELLRRIAGLLAQRGGRGRRRRHGPARAGGAEVDRRRLGERQGGQAVARAVRELDGLPQRPGRGPSCCRAEHAEGRPRPSMSPSAPRGVCSGTFGSVGGLGVRIPPFAAAAAVAQDHVYGRL